MEKWKIAVIAALLLSFVGYGAFVNSSSSPTPAIPPAFTAPEPSKYAGQTFPGLSNIKQWANSSAPVSLNNFKGHPILFEVFRTECSHCQDAAPFLVGLHARYAPRGVEFVAVQSPSDDHSPTNPENSWPQVQTWLKQKGYTWPVGFDPKRAWFKKNFGDKVSYPSLFLLDSSGKVTFFQAGHDDAKALQLAVQLERLAPGKGDAQTKATDVVKWVMKGTKTNPGPEIEKSLENGIASYLDSKTA